MSRHDRPDARSSKAVDEMSSRAIARAAGAGSQLELEDLAIDRAGEIPIGVQLAWALRARIGDGRLTPGQRLPGLRELAEMLGINANTARAVYQRMEQEGLIDSRQGTGTFVASVTQEPSAVGEIAAAAARQARRTGVDPRKVAAALYVSAEPPADSQTQAGERRRELRVQITALEQALSEIQASHPGLIPAPTKPLRQAGPRLLSVEELERVRADLVRRLAAAEPLLEDPIEGRKMEDRRRAGDVETQVAPLEQAAAGQAPPEQAAPKREKSTQARKAPRARPRPSTA